MGIDIARYAVLYSILQGGYVALRQKFYTKTHRISGEHMILSEEVYFEITLSGSKADVKKFVKFVKGEGLEDFVESAWDFINYSDDYADIDDSRETEIVFANDDCGIEISEFDTEEFLDTFCHAAKELFVSGHLYDINDDEYRFTSEAGSSDFVNARKAKRFNDELDDAAYHEELDED